ncbi:nicastrin-like [Salvelinus namaycush]|uniref:Nicastrin n=1 Tax=Salvelinus namaycush TaxID=8040 RepID=A0A8U1ESU2_SALNM|nr:nicastrin-like [Salvelinus namaycush]
MVLESSKWVMFIVCWLFKNVSCNSVAQKIYVELNNTVPCVRLLNATHQIGCQSSISGDTGVIHVLESEADLEWPLSKGPNPPYMVLLESSLFTKSIMMKMKNASSRVAGVVVVPKTSLPEFSPHTTCPNENTGVYTETYDHNLAHCNTTVWNPRGNGLSYEEFDFPVFSLKEDNETEIIKQCYFDHNRVVNGSGLQYPLCAMQLFSHMYAVTDTATCMRRSSIDFSSFPVKVCEPLGGYNVLAFIRPYNSTAFGHKENESVVIAAARLDSRAFFLEDSAGAEGSVSGFVTLLAAAQALREATQEAPPTRNILFAFFNGEVFDYIGSSRMVYDMKNNKFVIDLDNVHSILEIGQVAVRSGTNLFLHSDPVSRRNNTVHDEVTNLVKNLQSSTAGLNFSFVETGFSQPLPPSSFQRFLRARAIPGIVLADHQTAFNNRYYESFYDNAAHLNLTYPSNLSPEEQLEFVTDTAKSLTEVATAVARALFKQAGGNNSQVNNINADPKTVTQMLYGFLVRSNNSWFQAVMAPELKDVLQPNPPWYYVGVAKLSHQANALTYLVQYLLANLTGTATNLTQSQCKKPDELPNESTYMYSYFWVQGVVPPNSTQRESFCIRTAVRLAKAVSPAFVLGDYVSKEYSTWTESQWKFIKARIFLVASRDLEMLTLGVGVAVLFTSLLVTYFVSTKADVLFSVVREPNNAAY